MTNQKNPTTRPIAVLISDVHYSLPTLEVADAAMRLAIDKANKLAAPLIVAGDLHDTKANMRAECVNRMLETFALSSNPFVLIGNHDRINEKSESHSLKFLDPYVQLVSTWYRWENLHFVPYYSDVDELRRHIKYEDLKPIDIIIMHQGLQGSDSGEYYVDHSALKHEDVAHLNVISGHYHRRQTIDTGKGHTFSYIGNPYTLGFGEANHPEKGFQILMSDGSLEFVPTNLRKHVVIDYRYEYESPEWDLMLTSHGRRLEKNDIIWVKITGDTHRLPPDTKQRMAKLIGKDEFRLEIVPPEMHAKNNVLESLENRPQGQVLDDIIDSLSNTEQDTKGRVKALWKGLK